MLGHHHNAMLKPDPVESGQAATLLSPDANCGVETL